jgi:excisionase family DNA binding protein
MTAATNMRCRIGTKLNDAAGVAMRATSPAVQLLTVAQAAFRVQVSTKTILRRINAGELQAVRTGRVLRIDPRELERFLAARTTT